MPKRTAPTRTSSSPTARRVARPTRPSAKKPTRPGKRWRADLNATKAELDELRQQHADADRREKHKVRSIEHQQDCRGHHPPQQGDRDGTRRSALRIGQRAAVTRWPAATTRKLAAVLKQFPDRRFMVAGHADNVPIGPSNFKSNSELSTARAVSEFLASMGVNPTRLRRSELQRIRIRLRANGSEDGPHREPKLVEIVLLPNVEEISGLAKAVDVANAKTGSKPAK